MGAPILAVVDEHPGRLSHFVVAAGALGGGRLLRHLLRRQLAESAPGPDALDGPPR